MVDFDKFAGGYRDQPVVVRELDKPIPWYRRFLSTLAARLQSPWSAFKAVLRMGLWYNHKGLFVAPPMPPMSLWSNPRIFRKRQAQLKQELQEMRLSIKSLNAINDEFLRGISSSRVKTVERIQERIREQRKRR
jgi:hypothetical protein